MRVRHRPVNRVTIVTATAQANRHLRDLRAKLAAFDAAKAGENDQCKYCTFIRPDRIGGAAMTEASCGLCQKPLMFGSTCTDRLCPDCARNNGLCKHCGADLELKDRRKPYPFEDTHGHATD